MGFKTCVENGVFLLKRGTPIHGAYTTALDLRAGIALKLLGRVVCSETRIKEAWQIQRGFDDIIGKLRDLGADVQGS